MKGLRFIALIEFLKGAVVLLAGLGALEYLHHDLRHFGGVMLHTTALGHHAAAALMNVINGINDQNILYLATGIVAYSSLRFIESYGLYHERNWARWLAIISGGIYLPYEFYVLFEHFSWMKIVVTAMNIFVVVYLIKKHVPKKNYSSS